MCQICKTRVACRERTSAHEQALRKATCTHEFLVARCEHARCQVMCRSRPTEACRALGPAVMLCDDHEQAVRGHVCATTWPGNRAHATDELGGLHSCPISHSQFSMQRFEESWMRDLASCNASDGELTCHCSHVQHLCSAIEPALRTSVKPHKSRHQRR
jgi:hypothetical protein